MEKEELLATVTEIKKPIQVLSEIRREYRQYHTPYFNVAKLPTVIKAILGLLLFGVISRVVPLISFGNGILLTILGLASIIFTFFVYWYIEEKINLIQIKRKTTANASRIKGIIDEEKNIMNFVEEKGFPSDYAYPSAVDSFEGYLKNYRADSLKECINLYEQEMQHRERLNELRSLQQIQEMTLNEARSAKNLAFMGLFVRR
ncbi:hypothetical protein HPT25_26205 [Bacillus sp. BRMEA1]|uniref:hypothetical protein n=1 Tax=Neobacillus endophyticus TaxID=2738405 RepID=UPI001563D944|nr:hypothetical protein [Neobacillus endophyticus]NRD80824.1 hypothetical protein [Neobacillus endophyticus]